MKTADNEMGRMEKLLDDYEKSIGIPSCITSSNDIDKYMNMSRNVLEKLSQEDCAQIAYVLSSYAFYLQKMHNREISRITWAKSVLRDALADVIGEYGGKFITYDERKSKAIKHDEYACVVDKILNYAQARADRLTFLSSGIRHLVETLTLLQKSKIGNKFNG